MRVRVMGVAALASLAVLGLGAGCRHKTEVAEVARVDINLEGGNRGYLVGAPPATTVAKTTRRVLETTIELPGESSAPRPQTAPEDLAAGSAPDSAIEDQAVAAGEPAWTDAAAKPTGEVPFDSYFVKKGDSLWSIAAKPEIYGKAAHWRQLFDSNRDQLKTPDDLKVGMTLKVPRSVSAGSTTYNDEGITFKK